MTFQADRTTARPTTRRPESVPTAPRGGNYVTTSTFPAGSHTEGSYVTTPGGGSGNRHRAQGHYVTLANRRGDDTAGSYTQAS
ncbi:hypothetical protein QFZ79_003196 [Arthrobacter sp. V4I6]|uniref:hypothetical protein n=1 Tax=unclassified Arthrobacter TaxID=235627 RepID=UPI00278B90B0|nr:MULTISPECIES: hypothetical protein [unclassified Arthrobacter]MDQ0820823.1 hypothetical protein [Arthrobacter sp. V1I7]MDQ0855085.1 hypothetical protein [Arthrobacter sp. V4I6]